MTASATATRLMTTEQMLALPDDDVADRELIRGELRERPATRRNQWQCSAEARIAYLLANWLDGLPQDGSRIVSGEAGFRLSRNPDTTVGIDVALVSAEVVKHSDASFPYFEGAPVLAVEILSPSDTQEIIDEKIDLYPRAGVKVVWIVNARQRTIQIYRTGEAPEMVNIRQELSGGADLPGFRVPVSEVFRF